MRHKKGYLLVAWSVLAICALSSFVDAGDSSANYADLLKELRAAKQVALLVPRDELHASYRTATSTDEQTLSALALGVHDLERNPKAAQELLSEAKTLAGSGRGPLASVIDFYLAKAKLALGQFKESAEIAERLLRSKIGWKWREESLLIAIRAHDHNGDFPAVARIYRRYKNRHNFIARSQSVLQPVARAYRKLKQFDDEFAALEQLAAHYPTTEISRWAFRQTERLLCSGKLKFPGYSRSFLRQIGRNADLDEGIRAFVDFAADGPIRMKKRVRYLDEIDKVELLFSAKLYPEALSRVDRLNMQLQQQGALNDKATKAIWRLLGRIHLRLGEPEHAVRYFSKLLYKFPRGAFARDTHEHLADSLKAAGFYQAASVQYGLAANHRSRRHLRWSQFWTLYRAGQYEQALSLLEQRKGMPWRRHRSSRVHYWHARTLENLGRIAEAMAKFKDVLQMDSGGFYANLVASLYPSLIDKKPAFLGVRNKRQNFEFADLREALHGEPVVLADLEISEREQGLRLAYDLFRFGLREGATWQFSSLRMDRISNPESFRVAGRLGALLDDYRPSRSLRYKPFSPIRNRPQDWVQHLTHQKQHVAEWRQHYPLAFGSTVDRISRRVGLDPYFMLSLMRAESYYDPRARSRVGATGLMQIMPYTAIKVARMINDQEFRLQELPRPELNIAYSMIYTRLLLKHYRGSQILAISAYNAGPHAVRRWLKRCKGCTSDEFVDSIPYRETRNYVKRITTFMANYRRIYSNETWHPKVGDLPSQPLEKMTIF